MFFKSAQFLVAIALAIPAMSCVVMVMQDAPHDRVLISTGAPPDQDLVSPDAPPDQVLAATDAWSDQVVSTHNQARAKYGAGKVTWDNGLYAGTLDYAKKCKFVHSGGHYGENLYASSNSNSGVADGVNSWVAESSKYDYNHPGFSSATGHFTQVVWKATKQVTCALANCPKGTIFPSSSSNYLVCRYTPQGNVQGQFPQNVGRHV